MENSLFKSATSAWYGLAVSLKLQGNDVPSRNGDTREIIGMKYGIENIKKCWAGGGRHGNASLGYAYAELLWYLSLRRDIEMLGVYAPSYARFCDQGQAMGAYGYRWKHNPGIQNESISSLQAAFELLKIEPEDRRAVVSMWDSSDIFHALRRDVKDIPCTLNIQYIIRDNHLHSIVNMRSNDLFLGGIYDPFCFCQLQLLMTSALKAMPGIYHHSVGSFHMYCKDVKKVDSSLENIRNGPLGSNPNGWESPEPLQMEAEQLITSYEESPLAVAEKHMRDDFISGSLSNVDWYVETIPSFYKWSETALRAMHYHLEARSKN